MEIQQVNEAPPAPVKRTDYAELAGHYNALEVGKTLRIPAVYNTTLFRATLKRHGLSVDDVTVFQRSGHCYLTRLSETEMV